MIPKLLVTIGVLFYALAVPLLEINATHVFNAESVPHARLHGVWQLATNTAFGVFGLWLIWFRRELRLAAVLTFLVTGGFLVAYVTRGAYGGSMVLSDGSEKTLMGINLRVFAFGLAILLSLLALALDRRGGPQG